MKSKLKISLLCVCIFSLLFCFSACDVLPSGYEYSRHTSQDEIPEREEHVPSDDHIPTDAELLFEDGAMDEYKNAWHGIKTVYLPSMDQNYLQTTDQNLLSARKKFNQNATDQYYFMAWWIATALCDRFGVSTGVQSKTYTFFDGEGSPNYVVLYSDIVSTDELKIESLSDTSKKWICSLSTDQAAGYYQQYVSTFVPFLQLRFIEIALDLPKTGINSVLNLSTGEVFENVVAQKLNNYAQNINVLGINQLKQNDYISFVLEEVVGFDDLQTQVSAILNKFLNSIAPNFPTYDRTEISTLDANAYFDVGQQSNPTKLQNMDYQQYQSATFFCKDGQDPLDQFVYTLYIDSKQDITVDVYLFLSKANDLQKVNYLATLNTDSTKDFFYQPPVEAFEILDYNTVQTNQNVVLLYEDATKQQILEDEFLNVYSNPDSQDFGTLGYQNDLGVSSGQQKSNLLATQNDSNIHSLLQPVTKNGEEVDLSDLKFYADLSKDCVVLLFDIQYQNGGTTISHDDFDYGFKFLILPEGLAKDDVLSMFEEEDQE